MVIFNSYVKLPEGKIATFIPVKHPKKKSARATNGMSIGVIVTSLSGQGDRRGIHEVAGI
jgi:diphthamide synthase subunit DPH2